MNKSLDMNELFQRRKAIVHLSSSNSSPILLELTISRNAALINHIVHLEQQVQPLPNQSSLLLSFAID